MLDLNLPGQSAEVILAETEDLRHQLFTHPLYDAVNDVTSLRIFMEHHVFAVLDFMWLLKRLQNELCCISVPWLPVASPDLARFVNEIVLGEETDEDGNGGYCSHFELYLQAMTDVGADPSKIQLFVQQLRSAGAPSSSHQRSSGAMETNSVSSSLQATGIPQSVQNFVEFTHDIARDGSVAEVACVFCFGREDIIPDMFQRLLEAFEHSKMDVPRLSYYIRRHIELDGDHHGPLTRKMVSLLCDTPEKTQRAIIASRQAMQLRIRLWDGVYEAINATVK